ncbi:CaCA family Na+/Ca+ antiporter [Nitzschia inconspicua]|uniref:CaCA family Na+/Ca+ antiporter n=1 Tax=Nitzschia inconspicua TaxID=303405 RepID=A0A9K3PRM0_9STRA|nr:CaCA family Na+/Ca+ antiporter [Nitzschia inconspicua]
MTVDNNCHVQDFETGHYENHVQKRPMKATIETPIGITLCGKYQIKAAVQTITFLTLIAMYSVMYIYSGGNINDNNISSSSSSSVQQSTVHDIWTIPRFLQDTNNTTDVTWDEPTLVPCSEIEKAEPGWSAAFYSLGILYMFLALAITCDEFFVPALEEMSGPRRMNLSMDVAGATLMAAGGSAPELFTSLIGTFRESEIGFGTIVGSATFNILFVIGMCSLLAKEVLTLTWWPLFRDSSYYTVGLVVLAIFSGVVTPNEIYLWEAIVLFALYIGYILIMWQNANLYKALTGKVLEYPDDDSDNSTGPEEQNDAEVGATKETDTPSREELQETGMKKTPSKGSVLSQLSAKSIQRHQHLQSPHFRWQGTFRAGILKLLKDPDSWMDTAGVGIVSKIVGDADYVFQQVDIDGNGHVDREELKQLFNLLECYVSPQELEEVFKQLDTDGDGTISQKEFSEWYCRSEERILSQVRHVFDKIDVDHSNTIDKDELKTLLATLDPLVSDEDVQSALDAMYKHGSRDEITFEEFSDWYRHSMIFERQKQLIEEDMEGVWDNLFPPKDGSFRDWAWYIICFPLVLLLTCTIPDVQRPGNGKWCYLSFILSIGWIGGFSYLMVDWAEIVGATIGIPSSIMGLTVLAAGTSVPDLLSSVIVARRGHGDMAVSSSVGSNIFDILVGLPVPWILYTAWPTKPPSVFIGSEGLFRSLIILIAMLVLVISAVHCQGWKLTKLLGGIMFLFYIGFLVQAVVFALPFEICS